MIKSRKHKKKTVSLLKNINYRKSPIAILFFYFIENHFDLDLKEALDAPPLSLSTPDLHDLSYHNPFQPLRRSASSSELLYEKVCTMTQPLSSA